MIHTYFIVLILALISLFSGEEKKVASKYISEISADSLKASLRILTADSLEGRETGQPGQKRAANFIAGEFKRAGLLPGGPNGYFQEFPISVQLPEGTTIIVNNKNFVFLKDYYFFPGFGDQKIETNNVVFLGYGIDDSVYTDYHETDLKDKTIVILEGEPVDEKGHSLITGKPQKSAWTSNWRKKVERARSAGVKSIFVVVNDFKKNIKTNKHSIEKANMKLTIKDSAPDKTIPLFYISKQMARSMLSKDIDELIQNISPGKKTVSFNNNVSLVINVNRDKKQLISENVIGIVEGTDFKDQYIILTAHYDHLGKKGKEIFYGADDDGSGTSAIIELARVFAKAKAEGHGPRRSVIFMAVSGEEKGLLGSEYYVSNPTVPLNKIMTNLNIDMIGREDKKYEGNPNYIYIIGSDKLSTTLHEVNEQANKNFVQLELDYTYNKPNDPNRFYYRSDHYNFAKNNIPVIFYFNGVHDDYHKSTDTFDKINFKKMEKITSLVFATAWELVNRNERITVNVKNDFKTR